MRRNVSYSSPNGRVFSFYFVALTFSLLGACVDPALDQSAHSDSQSAQTETTTLPDGHSSRIALDWDGIYQGDLPCADCEAMRTMLTLEQDQTYRKQVQYLGRSDEVFEATGSFEWNASGGAIQLLNLDAQREPTHYFVGENHLIQLDLRGNRITGALASQYRLDKQAP